MRFASTLLLLAGAAFASPPENGSPLTPRTQDDPAYMYHPSPGDWRRHTVYQVITDRFYDGDPANNHAHTGAPFNPLSMDTLHGGDFAGLALHLDYIKALGFDVVWISPVQLNHRGVYHGYHITDFNRIDPHWGSLDDLRALVDAAHARGMYVIIDVVFNHMARLLTSNDPGYPAFSPEPYRVKWADDAVRFAPPFDRLDVFHGHGSIQDWENDDQNVRGDLQGLADLRTDREDVRQWLLESHLALIAATDCDGFRVDTAHHVEMDFWPWMLPRLRDGAAALGKTNFMLFAESLRGRDADVSRLTREGGFPSVLYYPLYFTLQDVWATRKATSLITARWSHLPSYELAGNQHLVTFGDNHDRARLLNSAYLDGDTNRVKALLAFLYAAPGIPCVYYGTEQGFAGSKGHRAREPMFHAGADGITDHFDLGHDLARWIRRLNRIRTTLPVLQSGDHRVLHDENEAGLFAFERTGDGPGLLVVLNNSTDERAFPPPRDELVDLLTGAPYRGVVPPDTTLILAGAEAAAALDLDTGETVYPAHRPHALGHHPAQLFQADGRLDDGSVLLGDNGHTRLHAAHHRAMDMLYVAVTPPAKGFDRFVFIAFTNRQQSVQAPWLKEGDVPAYDVLISAEGDSDYTSMRGAQGGFWSISRTDGVFEATLHVPAGVRTVWMRTAAHGTHDRGPRDDASVLPVAPDEWIVYPLD